MAYCNHLLAGGHTPKSSSVSNPLLHCHLSNLPKVCVKCDPDSFCSQKTPFSISTIGNHYGAIILREKLDKSTWGSLFLSVQNLSFVVCLSGPWCPAPADAAAPHNATPHGISGFSQTKLDGPSSCNQLCPASRPSFAAFPAPSLSLPLIFTHITHMLLSRLRVSFFQKALLGAPTDLRTPLMVPHSEPLTSPY